MNSVAGDIPLRWSNELGLALSGLFGEIDAPFGNGQHFALLDGVTASFGLSVADRSWPDSNEASAWAWSAYLRKHVWINTADSTVKVASVARAGQVESYSLRDVQERLEPFLEYLSGDREVPRLTVIDRVLFDLDRFRQVAHSTAAGATEEETDLLATRALLFDIARRIEPKSIGTEGLAQKYGISSNGLGTAQQLVQNTQDFGSGWSDAETAYSFHAGIAVRHAGGPIFQRATARLTLGSQLELFGGAPSASFGQSASLKSGGYFTPSGLARSLAEVAIHGKLGYPKLRICDPACGSGVFLAEVLRALARANYGGEIELVGRDILPFAVEIAQFVATCAAIDFGRTRVVVDIQQANSLQSPPGSGYDIVLMNPPFRSWEKSDKATQNSIRDQLGEDLKGKPDYSLAFAHSAFEMLASNGTLATLLPIGVLAADYSKNWRKQVSTDGSIELIASLGDHYIFDLALVNISAVVITKSSRISLPSRRTLMLWANESPRSSSAALRELRKQAYSLTAIGDSDGAWRAYLMPQTELSARSSWAPSAAGAENVIAISRERGFPLLKDLFQVKQGIRTGSREAFIVSHDEFRNLLEDEQAAFRPVVEKDGISGFKVNSNSYIFYSDDLEDPIKNENDFAARYPNYFKRYISSNLATLKTRPENVKPWELSRSRKTWLKKGEPRLLSRMFIGRRQFGFAVDPRGVLAVVQGYGWKPNWAKIAGRVAAREKAVILHAYAFIFSSELFFDMVRAVSVNIAGGQYDLSPKYIDTLPIPDWDWIKSNEAPPQTDK